MTIDAKEVIINGTNYIPKDSITEYKNKINTEGLTCSIIRTFSAGVFYGYITKMKGKEATVVNCKRIWIWYGAASLSELAVRGPSRPKECKIPVAVPMCILTEVIEIIPLNESAFNILESVPVWTV